MIINQMLDRGLLPDSVIRWGIRRRLAGVLKAQAALAGADPDAALRRFAEMLRQSPVAVQTSAANEQHYEVPAEFFTRVLGPRLKYSACLYESPATTLGAAEQAMLALTCECGAMADGLSVLELGCGWGSLSLYLAESYPSSSITAISNSNSQREFIMARARERGLPNLQVLTADMVSFEAPDTYDRIFSVEMFEHMRNYETLFGRVASWLKPDGRFFLHIFTHAKYAYLYEDNGPGDWMARHFFTGGMMPAADLVRQFRAHLAMEEQWLVNGTHYQRTLEDWLARMDAAGEEVMAVLEGAYGKADARAWWHRWRIFFMACAELFGFANGTEWAVSHYRFRRAA